MKLDDTYLRTTKAELIGHFAEVASGGDSTRHLRYYETSIHNSRIPAPIAGSSSIEIAKHRRLARQMEKDERFWVVDTLVTLFRDPDARVDNFVRLIEMAMPETDPPAGFGTWADALGDPDELNLYFEVNLPAPAAYKTWLADHLDERTLVRWIREDARASGKKNLEGGTKADAVLISATTHVAVVFEAKVLADASVQIGYDAARNQIARTIDVMLERNSRVMTPLRERNPDLTYFVLITPGLFKSDPTTRLYGWLMKNYRKNLDLLEQHLPHRQGLLSADLPSRLGWISWEECREIDPNLCPWLITNTTKDVAKTPLPVRIN